MIHDFYGLERDAFSLSPDLDFLFLSQEHEEAVAHLAYGLEQNEDIILIVGDIGTGKTLALHRVISQLSNVFVPVSINVTTMDFEQLLRLALLKLKENPRSDMDLASLISQFENTLITSREQGKKILLIIDEAQNLSLDVLESVRLLMNLAQPGGQALQLVISGQLGLQANISRPEMRQLRQRIRVDYHFGFLSRSEVEKYIAHRLTMAGGSEQLFDKGALDRIHELSRGIPRVVNYLASKALLAGFVDEAKQISSRHFNGLAMDELLGSEPHLAEDSKPALSPGSTQEAPVTVASARPADVQESHGPRTNASYAERRGDNKRPWGRLIAVGILGIVVAAFVYYPQWSAMLPSFSAGTTEVPVQVLKQQPDMVANAELEMNSRVVGGREPASDNSVDQAQVVLTDAARVADTPVLATPATGDRPIVNGTDAQVIGQANQFLLHVASFIHPERGAELKAQLLTRGVESSVRPVTLEGGKIWYRVYVGPFDSREEAANVAVGMKEKGWITFSRITTP